VPALSRIANFKALLEDDYDLSKFEALRKAEVTGRPIGDDEFIASLENQFERTLKPGKRGPKPDEGT